MIVMEFVSTICVWIVYPTKIVRTTIKVVWMKCVLMCQHQHRLPLLPVVRIISIVLAKMCANLTPAFVASVFSTTIVPTTLFVRRCTRASCSKRRVSTPVARWACARTTAFVSIVCSRQTVHWPPTSVSTTFALWLQCQHRRPLACCSLNPGRLSTLSKAKGIMSICWSVLIWTCVHLHPSLILVSLALEKQFQFKY